MNKSKLFFILTFLLFFAAFSSIKSMDLYNYMNPRLDLSTLFYLLQKHGFNPADYILAEGDQLIKIEQTLLDFEDIERKAAIKQREREQERARQLERQRQQELETQTLIGELHELFAETGRAANAIIAPPIPDDLPQTLLETRMEARETPLQFDDTFDITCIICKGKPIGHKVAFYPCGHTIHKQCLRKYVNSGTFRGKCKKMFGCCLI